MRQIENGLFDPMITRVINSRSESDTDYFNSLMYLSEMITKVTTLSIISGLIHDSNKTRYSHLCQIVRADGIGEWGRILDEILIGPSNHLVMLEMKDIVKELNGQFVKGDYQYESVSLIRDCLVLIGEDMEPMPIKVTFRMWFHYFARLRNKTRGHGAHKAEILSKINPNLESSVALILENFSLYKIECVYLFRNLSGRYRISPISKPNDRLEYLKSSEGQKFNYDDGVYLFLNSLVKIDLIETDVDLTDFFLPNGSFAKKTYEIISYISGNKEKRDNTSFLIPPNELPGSETDGLNSLEVIGNCFTNLPKSQALYVPRKSLENELMSLLEDDRRSIITLIGRGGIGKTTLALKVLEEICMKERYQVVLWFSARDIDLLEEGVKLVKPQVIGINEIAKSFVKLLNIKLFNEKDFNPKKYIEAQLNKSEMGPMLIIVDNFETIENPTELFAWLDLHIRLPNKILITSRIKDSKGDYPMTVSGMSRTEFDSLVTQVSRSLEIENIIDKEYTDKLFQESGGHPYIAKIMLGEVAKEGQLSSIKRISASKDEILTALFERTYNMLSPAARLVFLTLSSWRSIVPAVAVEAVVKTKSEEYYEIDEAIDELYRFSFVDKIKVGKTEDEFLFLPLSAHFFGQKKLSVSPLKHQITNYVWYLNFFGVGHLHNISKGIQSKISFFFRQVASHLSSTKGTKLEDFIPIIEYLCHKFPYAWNTLSILYEENNYLNEAITSSEKFIQYAIGDQGKIDGWRRIAVLSRRQNLYMQEANALVEICSFEKCEFEHISNTVKRIHDLIRAKRLENTPERKALLVRLIYVYKERIGEGDEKDLIELGWLLLNNQQFNESKKIATNVLQNNPKSVPAQKLAIKLKM